jgi:diguanylate cyclase (GGDEF)-like protein
VSQGIEIRPRTVVERLEALPRWGTFVIGLLVVAFFGYIDYVTGTGISISIFYLVPILYVTWFAGRTHAAITALIATTVWRATEIIAGAAQTSTFNLAWNTTARLGFFLVAIWLLSELKKANRSLSVLAHTDALTGVANARSFYVELEREIERLRRYGRSFALAYADLDQFKRVNDSLGHAAGDELLRRFAICLTDAVRDVDTVARLGGDEFAILMPETDAEAGTAALDRILLATNENMSAARDEVPGFGVTIGGAVFFSAPDSADAAVAIADAAMYAGKRGGGNRTNLVVSGTPVELAEARSARRFAK